MMLSELCTDIRNLLIQAMQVQDELLNNLSVPMKQRKEYSEFLENATSHLCDLYDLLNERIETGISEEVL